MQLIGSVIAGTVNFWLSTFRLPKGCIQEIETLCARFLWTGDIEKSSGAKVAWSTVSLPKQEGGLGLRRFTLWNDVLCLRYIWLLLTNRASLWSQWHRHHHIKEATFWAVQPRSTDSWNTLLDHRPMAQKFLKCRVGNGENTSFWFDSWTPFRRLIDFIGTRGPCDLRLSLTATVSTVSNGQSWTLPQPRSDSVLDLHIHLTTITPPVASAEPDTYAWMVNGTDCHKFSSAKTWDSLRPRSTIKPWASSICFKGSVLKHAFTMWVANLNRLPTKDKLLSWSLNIQPSCCLCTTHPEGRDHLFTSCGYAEFIWHHILAKLHRSHLFYSWSELMSWIRRITTASPTLKMLATQVTVYNI